MIHVEDTLRPEHVLLDLKAQSPAEAATALVKALQGDERVLDWHEFAEALGSKLSCRVADGADCAICVPHCRTAAVSAMVMAAARLADDLPFAECERPVRYIFCLGVPQAMAADYLRIAGLLMRIFADPATEHALREATTGSDFLAVLEGLEVKI